MSYAPHQANAKGNNLSDREREVLERQRKLAASIKAKLAPNSEDSNSQNRKAPPPPPPSSKTSSTSAASKPPSFNGAYGSSRSIVSLSKPPVAASSNQKKPPPPAAPITSKASSSAGSSKVIDLSDDTTPSSSDHQKRPTKRSNKIPSSSLISTTPATASLHASSIKNNATNTDASKKLPSPIIVRKKNSALTEGSSNALLAKLVSQAAASGNQGDGSAALSAANTTYGQYEPNDFWRNLRDWDFISQFDQEIYRQNQPYKKEEEDSAKAATDDAKSSNNKSKSLPDTFINHRHYIAAWAPLVMQEARAQLLSEVLSNVPSWTSKNKNQQRNYYVHVSVKTWQQHRDIATSSTLDSLTVQISPKNRLDNSAMPVMANDLCLLIPFEHRDILTELYGKGRNQHTWQDEEGDVDEHAASFRKYGLVGQIENSRKELNGLLVTVSKKWWAQMGQEDMVILKLGSNVTALREFTALTKIESLPLQRFLLGRDLMDGPHGLKGSDVVNDDLDDAEAVEQHKRQRPTKKKVRATVSVLLDKMGGVQALGKGFTEYAMTKFNPSQLTAISASANEYGDGGFTLIKGPPGTGKTTTLVGVLNSLHIRQFNKYYDSVRKIASAPTIGHARQNALEAARKAKPRLLVCAPSNAAVDNVILKIMEDGFIDGSGFRYNPSMIRVGVGQSNAVRDVSLETKVDAIFAENHDIGRLEASMAGFKMELQRITMDITQLRKRVNAIANACPWPLSKDWEIRIDDDSFDETGRVYFLNHKEKTTTFEMPPPPEPGEAQFQCTAMPEYRSYMSRIVKLVESYFSVKTNLERCTIVKGAIDHGANQFAVRQELEAHVLNSVHLVMTTLGTAGNRVMEMADKFEVVVIDEAAQSVEPSTLAAFQLGSRHSILVGDPQQLPATVFNMSGRNTKYDRSLFQRLEEAGHLVYMLNEQYRMHPAISHFPRHIFYRGQLLDGPNVRDPSYGRVVIEKITQKIPLFKPFTVLDLDSKEERGGTSLSNSGEAHLAVHLYLTLRDRSEGVVGSSRVAVVTPYAQQANLLRRTFGDALGQNQYERFVEVNTVDAFQGREASIVIFSAVRADGSKGIGFLSDVRRMNVALTRAKHFLFVLCRCESIVVNPYWRDLVNHARETDAVIRVPYQKQSHRQQQQQQSTGATAFGDPLDWQLEGINGGPRAAAKAPCQLVFFPEESLPPPSSSASANNDTSKPSPPAEGHPPARATQAPFDPRKMAAAKQAPIDPRKGASKPTASDTRKSTTQPKAPPGDPRKLALSGKQSTPRGASDPRKRKRLL